MSKKIKSVLNLIALVFNVAIAQTDGTLDQSFNSNGFLYERNFGSSCSFIQTDGKILVAGSMPQTGSSGSSLQIARYRANGTADISFSGTGITSTRIGTNDFSDFPSQILVEPVSEGNIYVAGHSLGLGSSNPNAWVVKYNAYGLLDNTFGQNGIAAIGSAFIRAACRQTDGKIILVGETISTNLQQIDFFVARIKTNGALDNTFGGGGGIVSTDITGYYDFATSITLQSDGKILVSGGANGKPALVRYNSDGTLDNSFGQLGRVIVNSVQAPSVKIELLPNGKVISLGRLTTLPESYSIIKFNSNGSLDNTFASGGILSKTVADIVVLNDMVLLPDGTVVIAGAGKNSLGPSDFIVIKHNGDGTMDTGFGSNGIVKTHIGTVNDVTNSAEIIEEIKVQTDGKIVAIGSKQIRPNGSFFTAIARYNNSLRVGIIDPLILENKVMSFPNPNFESNVNIEFDLVKSCSVNIEILDISGKILIVKDYGNLIEGKQNLIVQIPLTTGTYFLKINTNKASLMTKILKIK